MKEKILLIDGENLLHQSFHKFENLKASNGKPTGAIFGFFKSLHMYINRFNPSDMVITFDNGHSKHRVKLNTNYKEHRKDISYDRESLQIQKHIILDILGMLRINYIFDKDNSTNYEGDDFLAYQFYKIYNKRDGKRVLIISTDKDFNQLLISKRVKIYNPRKEEYITRDNCKEVFGYTPKETVKYLSLVGDKSDDIPGIKGIGPVKARKILDEYPGSNDWEGFIKSLSEEDQLIINRNNKLINLKWFIDEYPIRRGRKKLPLNFFHDKDIKTEEFKEICIEYSLNSFMTNEFINTFKNFNELSNKYFKL